MASSDRGRDEGLVAGYVGGLTSALGVVDDWIDTVRREFRSLAVDWEDIRQEVRTRLYQNLRSGRFRGDSDLRTYVHQITRNVCTDQLRGRYRDARGMVGLSVGEPVDRPASNDRLFLRDLLRRILKGLPGQDRALLHLVHVEHRSYEEVAGILGISEGAVKLRMFRCRRRILERRRRLLRRRAPGAGDP